MHKNHQTDRRSGPRKGRLLGALASAALLVGGCGDPPPVEVAPLLVVGIDGLDPVILDDLIAAGRVPTFARFATEGSLGRLKTMIPTFSPVIWTTIATGQPADVHGIDFFHDPEKRPYTSNARRVPAIWNLASDAGRTVDCVGWWVTWPAEIINGHMVASYAAQAQAEMIWKPTLWDQLEEMTWPRELAREIKPFLLLAEGIEEVLAPMRERFPIPDELDAHMSRMITDLAWTFAADLSVTRVTSELLERDDADLTLAYLAMPDVAGHRFWKYFRPGDVDYTLPPEHIANYADFIPLSYIAADRMLAQLIAKAGPETTVLILSDHGMHVDPVNTDKPFALNSGAHEDAPDGIIGILGPLAAVRGNELARPQPVGHVGEVAALVLQLEQVPVPPDWPAAQQLRRQLEGLLDVDWRLEHPLTVGAASPDFRPATPSRLPMEGMDTAFYQNMQDLGYLGGPEEEQAEREKAEREKAEREKAEREKAEREKAEREKAAREQRQAEQLAPQDPETNESPQ